MRGKAISCRCACNCKRITPAHAGKRSPRRCNSLDKWDHPRACGEKHDVGANPHAETGSPPRMRGKVLLPSAVSAQTGITPAHAGKRWQCHAAWVWCWDHPRACGEKQHGVYRQHRQRGITPAHAGKRVLHFTGDVPRQDHPRACGEKFLRPETLFGPKGSPPRMRGKVKILSYAQTMVGDHPRACGEKLLLATLCRLLWGSPPRMRGKEQLPANSRDRVRITPAHAGKRNGYSL